ncbi:MAG: hypothetical protein ACTSRP_24580 [Candidatus Helarchaeota archaeon]
MMYQTLPIILIKIFSTINILPEIGELHVYFTSIESLTAIVISFAIEAYELDQLKNLIDIL